MDFKGYFVTGDGSRCDPFTITDAHSRYLIRCQIVSRMDLSQVRAVCEAAMREYGMPSRIRTDDGAPFAGTGLLGLSKLSLGWMKIGIIHERIQPGRPQQNPYVAYCTSLDDCGKNRFEAARSWSLMPCCFRGGLSSGS
jgi:transposase InsO family protein